MPAEEPRTDFDAWIREKPGVGARVAAAVVFAVLSLFFVWMVYGTITLLRAGADPAVGMTGVVALLAVGYGILIVFAWLAWRTVGNSGLRVPRMPWETKPPPEPFIAIDPDAEYAALDAKRVAAIKTHVQGAGKRYSWSYVGADGTAEVIVCAIAATFATLAWFASVKGALDFQAGADAGLGSSMWVIMPMVGVVMARRLRHRAAAKGVMVGRLRRSKTLMATAALCGVASVAVSLWLGSSPDSIPVALVVGPPGILMCGFALLVGDEALVAIPAVAILAAAATSGISGAGGFDPGFVRAAAILAIMAVTAGALGWARNRRLVARADKDREGVVRDALAQVPDRNPTRRTVGAVTLQRFPDARAIMPLLRLFRDRDAGVARAAAIAFNALFDVGGANMPKDLMYRALMTAGYRPGDRVPAADMNAAHELACIRWHRYLLREFRRLLADPVEERRMIEAADPEGLRVVFDAAVLVLSDSRSERAIEHLFGLLAHQRLGVRNRARSILNGSGPYGTRRAIEIATSDDPRLRDAAARILTNQMQYLRWWCDRAAAIDPVFGSSSEPGDDDWVAEIAELREAGLPVLQAMLDDPDPEVRRSAEEGVVRFTLAPGAETDEVLEAPAGFSAASGSD